MHKKAYGRTSRLTLAELRNTLLLVPLTTRYSVFLILREGPVVATFTAGQTVSIEVTISAFHGGYYEFRLCVPKNVNDPAPSTNQAMLDCLLDPSTPILKRVNPLQPGQRADYKIITPPVWTQQQLETRWRQNPEDGVATGKTFGGQVTRTLEYKLPDNVQCRNCVLHWYWQSLNSWQSGTSDSIGTSTGISPHFHVI